MFQIYIDGVALREIAGSMNKVGIRTTLGNVFQETSEAEFEKQVEGITVLDGGSMEFHFKGRTERWQR